MPSPTNPNLSQLDQTQILQRAFDESEDRLRVDASVTATIGDLVISAEESDIAIKDRVTDNLLKINADGSIDANVVVSASGGDNIAISDGTDTLAINADGSINVTGPLTDTQLRASAVPVSATSLPLPTGAATEAKQTQPGVDIGDVTINNTSGAGAVNIQDGGNSITIDGTVSVSGSVAVTGPLTDAQLRASAVPVSLTSTTITNTVAISAASLPLPTGAATATNQATEIASLSSIDTKLTTTNSSLSSIDAGIPSALGAATIANSMPVNIASDQIVPISATSLPLPTGAATEATLSSILGNQTDGDQLTKVTVPQSTGSYPSDKNTYPGGEVELTQDGYGNLSVRGPILTDELSLRNDFDSSYYTNGTNIFIPLTGTLSFTNNSTLVTGSTTLFTSQIKQGDYIKKQTDVDANYVQVDYIESDTVLYLVDPYQGTTAATTGYVAEFKPTNSGGTSTVVTSAMVLSAPNGNNNVAQIERSVDYLPLNLEFRATLNQRVTNQTTVIGFQQTPGASPVKQACFVFDGTLNTQVKCRTSTSNTAADIEETTITLPAGATTATNQTYKIDLSGNQATYLVNDIVVAIHRIHLPGPYDSLHISARIANTAGGTGTGTFTIEYLWISNNNRIQIANDFRGEPDRVQLSGIVPTTSISQDLYSWGNNALSVSQTDLNKPTYSATNIFTAANLATDIFTVTGSATKTIRINKLIISGTQTTAGVASIFLLRRSTANTLGTSTTLTNTTHDSQNAAATAIVRSYTANPTLGTLVGNIKTHKLFIPTTTGAPEQDFFEWGTRPGQCIVLRGINEVFSVNLNGVTFAGNSISISVEWTEE